MSAVETKSAGDDILADLNRAFAAFKETNDERLTQIENRLGADVVTEEKLARIDHALDETKRRLDRLALDMSRPRIGGASSTTTAGASTRCAFDHYMRSGEASGLKALEAKALSRGSGPDGGYLVPLPTEREILRRLAKFSPIRAIASVREISDASLRRAFSTTGPAAGWVAEADPRPQTTNQQIADMTFPAMELYAMPAATQALLDDAVVDIEQWIAEEVQTAFAEQEGAAFVSGDGVNKPKGFLSYTTVADASWTWGNIGYVATGVGRRFRREQSFRRAVQSRLCAARRLSPERQIRDEPAHAVARPPVQDDDRRLYLGAAARPPTRGASLMNFPVVEAEDMPDPARE